MRVERSLLDYQEWRKRDFVQEIYCRVQGVMRADVRRGLWPSNEGVDPVLTACSKSRVQFIVSTIMERW